MLSVANLTSFYGRAQILFDVELQIGRGEVVALLGRNGAGKSTTFRSVMGAGPRPARIDPARWRRPVHSTAL